MQQSPKSITPKTFAQIALDEGLGPIENSYEALQFARIKKNADDLKEALAAEEEIAPAPTALAQAEDEFRAQLRQKMPADCADLCLPDFPMIPIGEKVIVKPLAQADFVVNKIIHVQTQDNPGGKCSLGIVAAIGREVHAKAPYLKVGDVVYFNPLSGSRLNLLYGGKAEDLYILWLLNIEAAYYGAFNEVYGKGAVSVADVPQDGARLEAPDSIKTGAKPESIAKTLIN